MSLIRPPQDDREARRQHRMQRAAARRRRHRNTLMRTLIDHTATARLLQDRITEKERARDEFKATHAGALRAATGWAFVAFVVFASTFAAAVLDYILIHDLVEWLVGDKLGISTQAAIIMLTAALLLLELRVGLEFAQALRDRHDEDGDGWLPVIKWGIPLVLLLFVVPAVVAASFTIAGYAAVYRPALWFQLVLCVVAHAVVLLGAGSLREAWGQIQLRWSDAAHERGVRGAQADRVRLIADVRETANDLNDLAEEAEAAGTPLRLLPLPRETHDLLQEAFGYELWPQGPGPQGPDDDGSGGAAPMDDPADQEPVPTGVGAARAPAGAGELGAAPPAPGNPPDDIGWLDALVARQQREARNEV